MTCLGPRRAALWVAIVIASATPARGRATSVLGEDGRGRLAFLQLGAADVGETTHEPLYEVDVAFDIQEMDAAAGATMVLDQKQRILRLDTGKKTGTGIAWGHFEDRINATGWSELYLETTESGAASNDVKMYAAGFVEGLLTCVRLSEFYANSYELLMTKEKHAHALVAIKDLFKKQISYLKKKTNLVPHLLSEEPEDPYWKHVRYLLFQVWGVCDGYNYAAKQFGVSTLGLADMLLLNAGGELPQMMEAFAPAAVDRRLSAKAMGSFLQRRTRRTASSASGSARGTVGGLSDSARTASSMSGSSGTETAGLGATDGAAAEDPLDDAHWERRVASSGRCSALVRLAAGNQDLFVGHTTWDDYSKMTRVFKYYKFNLDQADTMATHIAFSSYPGVVSSTDDFYILNSGLAVAETSLELLDASAWDGVPEFPEHPHIPNFMHVMVVNRLAKNAGHWVRLLSSSNAGTYAAQWMVVDYNQFEAGSPLRDNTFWVLEAVPGFAKMQDMTNYLRTHEYWPSFNRPYFKEIREVSGHEAAERSHGLLYSWGANPRAELFARAGGANALLDMRGLMSQNSWPHSGAHPSGPGHEISARMDLAESRPIPNGGIDAKVTNRCLFARMQAQAISGPSHSEQKPFRWRSTDGAALWPGWLHDGQPDVWDFNFVQMTPSGAGTVTDVDTC